MENSRITYDSSEILRLMNAGLDKLNTVRYDSKYKMLLGEKIIEKLTSWDNVTRMQQEEPLTVVVCGEFKRGKSSLINAILGEDVVTTDITTETITINKICYGEHSNEIILSGGKRIRLKDEELKSEKLQDILQNSTKGSNQLLLKRPIELLKDVTIIDTPGLGDSLADFSDDVEKALRMADAVIYVFSVSYPLSTQEQYFIKTNIVPQKYTDLILVGNYADVIECEEDYQKVQETVKNRIADIIPDIEPIFLSALDERCKQLEQKRPNTQIQKILEGNFINLRNKFNSLLDEKAEYVIPDRIKRLLDAMLADLQRDLFAIEQGLTLDSEQMQEKIEAIKNSKNERGIKQTEIFDMIDRKCEVYRANSVEWIETLLNRLETDAATLQGRVSTDDIKRFYTLFCVETLQEAFNKCAESYLSVIYDELTNISPELSKKFSFDSAMLSPKFVFQVNNNTFTSGDKIAFAGNLVASNMGLSILSTITNYIGGYVREQEIEKKSPDYIESIKKQLSGLHLTVIPALSKSYGEIADRAKEQISAYFENELQALENEVSQAITVSNKDDATKDEIRAAVDYLNGLLKEINNSISIE